MQAEQLFQWNLTKIQFWFADKKINASLKFLLEAWQL